jgi:DNA-binding IclR family transcriptional regulator
METSSLSKALRLLEATAGHALGRSLADLATETGLPKPTAHRLLNALAGLGYLERPAAGMYRQSATAKRLVSDDESRRLIEAAGQAIQSLHAATRETVNLGMLKHARVIYLEVLESTQALRRVASRASDPFHSTALGRAIAAFLPESRIQRLLDRKRLERRTAATLTDAKRLQATLAKVRRTGYAMEIDETDVGVTCIGAPVFAGEEVIGAISVSVPTARAVGPYRSRLVKLVREAARTASKNVSRQHRRRG